MAAIFLKKLVLKKASRLFSNVLPQHACIFERENLRKTQLLTEMPRIEKDIDAVSARGDKGGPFEALTPLDIRLAFRHKSESQQE